MTPLARVAVYAPGGTAAYPSSVLMAAIPARVAGVGEIVLFTPRATDVVVLAAQLAGVDRIFVLGGAQAIAAAALGTATVPRVDKIVGPGNAYVTAAKRQVFGLCDIDGIAGPSEILILADATAEPELIAADLIAQAEHDRLACPVLVTDEAALVEPVQAALCRQLADLPRSEIAAEALRSHGALVLVSDRPAMVAAANEYAPEHLELLLARADELVPDLRTAGAIFVGRWTPEAAGDYTAGPSHVLPTAGAARYASPLGVWDFVKYTSVLRMGPAALREQSSAIVTLARAEGLEGHARAVLRRCGDGQGPTREEHGDQHGDQHGCADREPYPWEQHLRPSLRALTTYHVPQVRARARLHANECPEPWPAAVMEDLAQAVAAIDLGRYPDRSPKRLQARIAEAHGCPPQRVILGNGSDEIIALLLTVLSGETSRASTVLLPAPTFGMYRHSASALGLETVEVPLSPTLELEPAAMRRALRAHSPALCFLARPNNPTSSLWDRTLVLELVAEFPATVFVIDEAYIAYAPGESLWADDRPSNYVHMGTLSKVGLAAVRLGYCIASPILAAALDQVRPPYNIPEPTAVIADRVLERHGLVQAAMIERTIANRARLSRILAAIPGAHVFPAHANIVLARLDPPAVAPQLCKALAARGILIKDVSKITGLGGCVRVSVGARGELDLLEGAVADLSDELWPGR